MRVEGTRSGFINRVHFKLVQKRMQSRLCGCDHEKGDMIRENGMKR